MSEPVPVTLKQRPKTAAPRMSVDYFNVENPRSLVNIVSERMREALLDPGLPRYWLDLSESQLKHRVEAFLDERDTRLRLLFWDEYNQAQDEKRMMIMERVFGGACSSSHWHATILKDPHKLIWIITPPASYEVSMRELLQMSLVKLREVLALPIIGKNGKPDISLIKEIVKIHALVDNRVQGAVMQTLNVNQKSLSVNVNAKSKEELDPAEVQIENMDAEIESLQLELAQDVSKVEIPAAHPLEDEVIDEEDNS